MSDNHSSAGGAVAADLIEDLKWVRQRVRNCRGAIESNQVEDKDVRGSLLRITDRLDDIIARLGMPGPAQQPSMREALRRLEEANEQLAAKRTDEQYQSMINAGQEPELDALDEARRNARSILAAQPPAAPVETGYNLATGERDNEETDPAYFRSSAGSVPPERRFLIDALDALEAIDSEIVLTGHMKELVDCALAARNADFTAAPQPSAGTVQWPEPKVTNPDIANPTSVPYLNCLIHRILDAQQDINFAANEEMNQSLCDAAALFDEVETALRRAAGIASGPQGARKWQIGIASATSSNVNWQQDWVTATTETEAAELAGSKGYYRNVRVRMAPQTAPTSLDLTEGQKHTLERIRLAKAAGIKLDRFWLDFEEKLLVGQALSRPHQGDPK
ncbi:hypothetical protein IVB12_15560 [Bradyrhizobium sp. 179]|uniref:hypothetical protein n=1 Tax=Bradyrhizobium sp. 179 TaxID=2782648 RepID=UPI001FF83707|nr:hypothetical protein [Bradyrhizobium sp. 179]MCK1543332.1 hypothetical protein [Bradyrhizobium sp. 179]